jgi:hypothetical protein
MSDTLQHAAGLLLMIVMINGYVLLFTLSLAARVFGLIHKRIPKYADRLSYLVAGIVCIAIGEGVFLLTAPIYSVPPDPPLYVYRAIVGRLTTCEGVVPAEVPE